MMQKDETENKINGEACGRESEVIFNPLLWQKHNGQITWLSLNRSNYRSVRVITLSGRMLRVMEG